MHLHVFIFSSTHLTHAAINEFFPGGLTPGRGNKSKLTVMDMKNMSWVKTWFPGAQFLKEMGSDSILELVVQPARVQMNKNK